MKRSFRQLTSYTLYSTLNSVSSENRKKLGNLLDQTSQNGIGKKFLNWYYEDHPVDGYMISFPKCGRTWLRLMIGRVFECHFGLEDPEILNKILKLEPLYKLNPAIPRIRVSHDDNPQWKKPNELETSKEKYKPAKVILLSRDPRDVVVSAFFEQKKRIALWEEAMKNDDMPNRELVAERLKPYEGSISEFLYEEVGSLKTIIQFYNIWAENHHVPKDLLLIRYEDMHNATQHELRRVLDFLDVKPVKDEIVLEAVEYTSFKNMHKMEAEDQFKSTNLRPADKADESSYKTRKGKVGGFVDYFNADEISYMNQVIRDQLSPFYHYDV